MMKFKSIRTRIWVLFSIVIILSVVITSILTCISIELKLGYEINLNILKRIMIVVSTYKYMILIICIASFFVAKIIADYISKPLKKLEEYACKISQKQWIDSIQVESEDEIGSLMHAMNDMQKQLKMSDEEQKMFLQSISHDLKTPVMVIMAHAEAILDGVYLDNLQEAAGIIKNESIRLDKKIKNLLYLNSLDYILDNENYVKQVNLKNICIDIVNKFKLLNENIKWIVEGKEILIQGNEENLFVCIENIVENALRYCKSEIKISIYEEYKYYVIEIFNDGAKIKEDDLNKIFKNSYKGKNGKFGLGLAISRKIVIHYNGDIIAQNKINGVIFKISFNK